MFNSLKNTAMFKSIVNLTEEFFSNIWVKLVALIPVCFFSFSEREKVAIFALLIIMMVDCMLGSIKAAYLDRDFSWNLLGRKFSMKFILFFLFLGASFILSKAFQLVYWWFYAATALIAFSEFGSLTKKAQALGLPIKSDVVSALNCKLENWVMSMIGMGTVTQEDLTKKFEEKKAAALQEYNQDLAKSVKVQNASKACKLKTFNKDKASTQKDFETATHEIESKEKNK
jgi:hypothetical protein